MHRAIKEREGARVFYLSQLAPLTPVKILVPGANRPDAQHLLTHGVCRAQLFLLQNIVKCEWRNGLSIKICSLSQMMWVQVSP